MAKITGDAVLAKYAAGKIKNSFTESREWFLIQKGFLRQMVHSLSLYIMQNQGQTF